jgi:hypothetical protein
MSDKNIFERYLMALRKTPLEDQTEHTGRSALENLLQAIADSVADDLVVHQETKQKTIKSNPDANGPVAEKKAAPDFKVTKGGTLILGYVENKAIGENLDKVLKSEQIAKYKSLFVDSPNIILTDYLRFIWIGKHGTQQELLCHAVDFENPKCLPSAESVAGVSKILRSFFSNAPQRIGDSEQLALALAMRSKLLHDYLGEELVRQEQEHKEGRLYGLYQIFRDQVFHELQLNEFADAFAQMLAYGLFLARFNSESHPITLHNAREYVPGSFRLIQELVDFLTDLEKNEYRDVRWVVEEVLSLLNALDLAAIHRALSFRHRRSISRRVRATNEEEHRLFERDPFIYFYEDYLRAYDKETSKARGVYYTPPPVVNFIVRAVDDLLKKSLGIASGLADHKRVTVLDFACGTGTFLVEVFQRIFENVGGPDVGGADLIVREHFLKHIFGFEYLIAPYTIAHLKLSQYLADQRHPLKRDQRLQVFLTNTLEPIEPQANLLLPAVSAEVKAAQSVKERPILVIVGNPPYSVESKNTGAWITSRIEPYKFVDGKHFRERKHSLGDDYVKFIRFAQLKMDEIERGIVGVITNRRYLDNVTFRGMRQSLLATFDQVYIFDLGGASGSTYENGPDENVFDITIGVAITIFAKTGNAQGVWYHRVGGTRIQKYEQLAHENLEKTDWIQVCPTTPNYFFVPHSIIGADETSSYGLRDIFKVFGVGIYTARDALTIAFTAGELASRIKKFAALSIDEARSEFKLGKDAEAWSVEEAQDDLKRSKLNSRLIRGLNYRPFDCRFTYYTGKSNGFVSRPTHEVMRHLLIPDNPSLVTCRLLTSEVWTHVLITDGMIDNCYISSASRERAYAFPLYLDHPGEAAAPSIENLSPNFRAFIDAQYEHHYTPQEILGYIYGVLYAPTFRAVYAEFLRIDFPRIPFPNSADDFERLSKLGWSLVQRHLLRELPGHQYAKYDGKGDHSVEAVRYSPKERALWINDRQRFTPVPIEVWQFRIGGYQILDKYLKSRKGRKLSLDEINHVGEIADSLAFTIEQMIKIDKAFKTAFAERG